MEQLILSLNLNTTLTINVINSTDVVNVIVTFIPAVIMNVFYIDRDRETTNDREYGQGDIEPGTIHE